MHLKQHFTTKRLVLMALFVALSYVLTFFEFPIFPIVGFLKLDFGNVFSLLPAFLLGPVEGVLVCGAKEVLSLMDGGSFGVGELANFLLTSAFILLPSVVYQFRKGFGTVALSLSVSCILATGASLVINRFITFPLYEQFLNMPADVYFRQVFWYIVAFNLIKTVSVSLITVLLYKRLSMFLKKKHI